MSCGCLDISWEISSHFASLDSCRFRSYDMSFVSIVKSSGLSGVVSCSLVRFWLTQIQKFLSSSCVHSYTFHSTSKPFQFGCVRMSSATSLFFHVLWWNISGNGWFDWCDTNLHSEFVSASESTNLYVRVVGHQCKFCLVSTNSTNQQLLRNQ